MLSYSLGRLGNKETGLIVRSDGLDEHFLKTKITIPDKVANRQAMQIALVQPPKPRSEQEAMDGGGVEHVILDSP